MRNDDDEKRALSRRELMLVAASTLSVAALPGCANRCHPGQPGRASEEPVVVDAHCHIFNIRDLPYRNFVTKTQMTEFGVLIGSALASAAEFVVAASMSGALGFEEYGALDGPAGTTPAPPKSTTAAERQVQEQADTVEVERALAKEFRTRLDEEREKRGIEGSVAQLELEELIELAGEVDESSAQWIKLHDDSVDIESGAARKEKRKLELVARGRSLLNFFRILRSSRREIAGALVRDNPQVSFFTPALVDLARWTGPDERFRHPLTEPDVSPARQVLLLEKVQRLAIRGQLPLSPPRKVAMHGFAAFCPRREVEQRPDEYPVDALHARNAQRIEAGTSEALAALETPARRDPLDGGDIHQSSLAAVRYAVEKAGFVGVKLYPPVGFKPLGNAGLDHLQDGQLGHRIDAALHRLYAWCEAEEIALIVHVGKTNSFHRNYVKFSQPRNWAPVLRLYPKLRLNLGHIGHEEGWLGGDTADAWATDAARLMQSYDHVHGDLGNAAMDSPQHSYVRLLRSLLRNPAFPRLRKKLMYGSDFFMNNLISVHPRFFTDMQKALAEIFAEFPGFQEDFNGRNALRLLGLASEDGKPVTGKAQQRLTRFYADLPKPAWLANTGA
jgi:predicted TIM-barrel fold metal-dependent hydrolase